MYLADKLGWPYERRKGRPVHNFIRACVLILRGQLWFKRGEYEPKMFDNNGELDGEMQAAGEQLLQELNKLQRQAVDASTKKKGRGRGMFQKKKKFPGTLDQAVAGLTANQKSLEKELKTNAKRLVAALKLQKRAKAIGL